MPEMEKETALDLADTAMGLARHHGLPPVPKVFEVLFDVTQKSNASLLQEFEAVAGSGEPVTESFVLRLYDEHCSAEAKQLNISNIEQTLSSEISNIFTSIASGMESGNVFSGKLKESIRDLSTMRTKEELREAARSLFKSNQTALASATELNQKLENSKAQIEQMRSQLDKLKENALTDHLTGVLNRRAFDDAIKEETGKAGAKPLALVILDIDHFKSVNDTWGHATGDNVLRLLGQLLRKSIKGQDKPARLGGEEFALILPNTDLNGAKAVTEHIRETFKNFDWIHQESGDSMGTITISAGAALFQPGESVESLYERADKQLYQAKETGRDKMCLAA